jgi:hypothetical protein
MLKIFSIIVLPTMLDDLGTTAAMDTDAVPTMTQANIHLHRAETSSMTASDMDSNITALDTLYAIAAMEFGEDGAVNFQSVEAVMDGGGNWHAA